MKACDYVSFDNQGTKDYSIKSESTYEFYKIKFDYDSNYSGASSYFFTFPIRNASFRFYAVTTDKEWVPMGTEFVDNVNIGESYWFVYDFEDDTASWYDMTPNSIRSKTRTDALEKFKDNENDRIVYDYEGLSISIQ